MLPPWYWLEKEEMVGSSSTRAEGMTKQHNVRINAIASRCPGEKRLVQDL